MKNNKARSTCSYLYADGHAVVLYEQTVKLGNSKTEVEYAVIHEKWTEAHLGFKGRLCFSRYDGLAMLNLCKRASTITAHEPTTEHGSENTRKLGLSVGSLSLNFPDGSYLHWTTIPGLISAQHTYQPEHVDAFDGDRSTWGMCKVAEIKRAPVKLPMAA